MRAKPFQSPVTHEEVLTNLLELILATHGGKYLLNHCPSKLQNAYHTTTAFKTRMRA